MDGQVHLTCGVPVGRRIDGRGDVDLGGRELLTAAWVSCGRGRVSVGCAVLVAMSAPLETEAEARAAVAKMEPIMAIEGRQMSDRDKELLVDLIRGVIPLDEVATIIAREAGYELD